MKIKALGNVYEFPERPLELGEQRLLKREFGFIPGRDELDLNDPDHLGAFLFAAMRNADLDAPAHSLIASINRVREIEIVGDDDKPLADSDDGADPTPAKAKKPKAEDDESGK